jgi:hypothetical protein
MPSIEINKNTVDVVETSIDMTRSDQEATWAQLVKSKGSKKWISELKQGERSDSLIPATRDQ